MTVWFTSDTHFYHKNIIKYSNRPFSSVDEMNAKLIENWNSVVNDGDLVYHLGDFSFCGRKETINILEQLKGQKFLILGNHDHDFQHQPSAFKHHITVMQYNEIKVDGHPVVLFHYGMRVWNKSHRGSIQLYGHSHGTLPGNSQQLDVGVDCWNYTPCNFQQIKKRLATLPLKAKEFGD